MKPTQASKRSPKDADVPDHLIWTRRWNDPKFPQQDGTRVLVCRYWPRGLRKGDETWELWIPDLGPSKELHAAYYGKHGPPIGWLAYRERYLEELESRRAAMAPVLEALKAGNVTLLCSSACVDDQRCHRTLLAAVLKVAAAVR